MSPSMPAPGELSALRGCLSKAGFRTLDDTKVRRTPLNRIRRSGRSREEDRTLTLTLVERDSVLYWEEEDVAEAPAGGFRGLRRGGLVRGTVLDRFVLPLEQPLEPSQVYGLLTDLDKGFNGQWGLKEWDGKDLNPVSSAPTSGPLLLFVHGTFSDATGVLQELKATTAGKAFLKAAKQHYKAILAFDHPTLSVSPMLNALDLGRLFQAVTCPVDVISHSRGGLVTRWWLEAFDRGPLHSRRAALVGSPLHGTSLAAPPRLRGAMSFLSNLNRALATGAGMASPVLPFLTVFATVFRIAGSLAGAVAKTPVIDAAVAMVPGLSAMSRISNNFELERLRSAATTPRYFFVKSNFEPKGLGWKFWEVFVDLKDRAKNAAADAIFREANDLVVDTASMTDVHAGFAPRPGAVYDFGTTNSVHHTNYFRQAPALDFLRQSFGF